MRLIGNFFAQPLSLSVGLPGVGCLVECAILFMLLFRGLGFATNAIPYTIELERLALESRFFERRLSCDKLAVIMGSIGTAYRSMPEAGSHLLTASAMSEVESQVRDCRSDVTKLETLRNDLSPFMLLKYLISAKHEHRELAVSLVTKAADNGRTTRCSQCFCIDWRTAFDITLLFEILSPILIFSISSGGFSLLILSGGLTITLAYAGWILKKANKRALTRCCESGLVAPLVLNKLLLSQSFRHVRIAALCIAYMSAFTVLRSGLPVLLSLWILVQDLPAWRQLIYVSEAYTVLVIVAVQTTSIRARYRVKSRHDTLETTNKDVARLWVFECLHLLPRLSDMSLLEVLKSVEVADLSDYVKDFISQELSRRTLLVSIESMSNGYRDSDISPMAMHIKDLRAIRAKLQTDGSLTRWHVQVGLLILGFSLYWLF